MYELMQVGERSFYFNCPAKIGLFLLNDHDVCLIDSGNDKEAGRKVLKCLKEKGWTLKMILNTHSHADHIGGNLFLQQRTDCAIYAPDADAAFTEHPFLESAFLYGGYPCKPLRNKFLCAQASNVQPLTQDVLPDGITMLRLDGHSFAMSAFKTADDIWFLADCLTSETILQKYHVSFLYDVAAYQQSLATVRTLQGNLFIPSHAESTNNINTLVDINLAKMNELITLLTDYCTAPISFEHILKSIFNHYALTMDFTQHALVGSTIRSYLSYLHDQGILTVSFCDNQLYWQRVDNIS